MKTFCCFFAGLLVLSIVITARAEEGGTGAYTPGAFASFVDVLPSEPGEIGIFNYITHYNGNANASRSFPIAGDIAANVNANVNADTPGIFWNTSLKFLGGYYTPGISFPLMSETVKAQVTSPINVQRSDTVNGLGDIEFWPVAMGWTLCDTNLHVDFLGGVFAPTGDYNKGQLANLGLNYWTFEPGVLASYLSQKYGFEVTTFLAYDINTENNDTGYQSGQVFHLDGTVAQHLPLGKGFIGVGAKGFYLQQTTADSGSGAKLGSFEETSAGVGPVVSYAAQFDKTGFGVEVTWLPQVENKNTLNGDYVWVKFGVSF